MQAFIRHTGKVIPLDRANVDTDALLPKQYLKSISKFGFADWLFDDFRYLDPGDVNTDTSSRRLNPDFVLNKPGFEGGSVLLSRANFGCGSSREHAVWALRDYGIRVVLASSFADIFYNNCFKNGILPLALPVEKISQLFQLCKDSESLELTVDLENCQIRISESETWSFTIDAGRRENLLTGRDEIAVTLLQSDVIRQFESHLQQREPWAF